MSNLEVQDILGVALVFLTIMNFATLGALITILISRRK